MMRRFLSFLALAFLLLTAAGSFAQSAGVAAVHAEEAATAAVLLSDHGHAHGDLKHNISDHVHDQEVLLAFPAPHGTHVTSVENATTATASHFIETFIDRPPRIAV